MGYWIVTRWIPYRNEPQIKYVSIPNTNKQGMILVGKLIYLSHSQPEIAYVVSVVSQFMHSPSEDHLNSALRILRYLKGSQGKRSMVQEKSLSMNKWLY